MRGVLLSFFSFYASVRNQGPHRGPHLPRYNDDMIIYCCCCCCCCCNCCSCCRKLRNVQRRSAHKAIVCIYFFSSSFSSKRSSIDLSVKNGIWIGKGKEKGVEEAVRVVCTLFSSESSSQYPEIQKGCGGGRMSWSDLSAAEHHL